MPGDDSGLKDRAGFPSSKTARPVAGSRSAYRAWQVGNGTAKAVLFYAGQGPDPNCRRVAVVGSRVKHVGSGLGAGPIFLCPDRQCRAGASPPPYFVLGKPKGRSPQKRPNTIILSQL